MTKKFHLDDIARDIAIEINLGGDRFTREDVEAVLKGISRKDLEFLSERVSYHCEDYHVPSVPSDTFADWIRKQTAFYLSGVECSKEGAKNALVFAEEPFYKDRGKYFYFSGGNIRRCDKATRSVMWGPEVNPVLELDSRKAVKALCATLLCDYGQDRLLGRVLEFSCDYSLPQGRVIALQDSKERGVELIFEDHTSLPIQDVPSSLEDSVASFLIDELDEQHCIAYNQKVSESNLRDLFKEKADLLLDAYGVRVKSDFLYDEVELHPRSVQFPNRVHLRREVDDVSKDGRKYYLYSHKDGGLVVVNIASLSAPELENIVTAMDQEMRLLSEKDSLGESIVFDKGPLVTLPYPFVKDDTDRKMVVESVFLADGSDDVLLSGRSLSSVGRKLTVPLMMLSDSSICAVRDSMDQFMRRHINESLVSKLSGRIRQNSSKVKASGVEI